ncbi:MAG: YolD-like family protein [Hespellia sp.]|nr:YolD-like family protein [Hespellia sp.]
MNPEEMHKYDDILMLPHHVSRVHPQMEVRDRAAQFAPFAALAGHSAAIEESARLTDARRELDENCQEILNRKLQTIQKQISAEPMLTVTYFVPDSKKTGGSYVTVTERVKKIDAYERTMVLADKTKILLEDVIEIELEEDETGRNAETFASFCS